MSHRLLAEQTSRRPLRAGHERIALRCPECDLAVTVEATPANAEAFAMLCIEGHLAETQEAP